MKIILNQWELHKTLEGAYGRGIEVELNLQEDEPGFEARTGKKFGAGDKLVLGKAVLKSGACAVHPSTSTDKAPTV